jgi:outer membrane protein OmpA-like peptidoglycan-associated protein
MGGLSAALTAPSGTGIDPKGFNTWSRRIAVMLRFVGAALCLMAFSVVPVTANTLPQKYVLFFDYNSSSVLPSAGQIIEAAATKGKSRAHSQVIVYAYSGGDSKTHPNPKLSAERRSAVEAALQAQGIAPAQIVSASLKDGDFAANDVALRRIEIRIVPAAGTADS